MYIKTQKSQEFAFCILYKKVDEALKLAVITNQSNTKINTKKLEESEFGRQKKLEYQEINEKSSSNLSRFETIFVGIDKFTIILPPFSQKKKY